MNYSYRIFLIVSIVFLVTPIALFSQTHEENYIHETIYQTRTQTDINIPSDDKIELISYLDGIGRPKQNINLQKGGNREDLVTPIIYDDFGRQPKSYLPYPVENSQANFIENSLTPLLTYYYNGYPNARHPYDINPYNENRFETSPINRVLETGAPGKDWEIDPNADTDHTIKYEYQVNASWEVRLFRVGFENNNRLAPKLLYENDEKYPANELFKTVTKDENWQPGDDHKHTTEEFKNKLGQVVLKRSFGSGSWENIDTYYVYDDFGRLTYVLSPQTESNIISSGELISNHQEVLDDLCYQYKYDSRNRLIEKKNPGKGWEYIVYNKLDKPVLTQDQEQRINNVWLFTKYDALGRVAYTGKFGGVGTRETIQNFANNQTIFNEQRTTTATAIGDAQLFYTKDQTYPIHPLEVLTVNYYDDYVDFTGLDKPILVLGVPTTENSLVTTTTKGLPTVSKVRVLGTSDWITTLKAYDEKGRTIYIDTKNDYLDTRDFVRSELDFTGKVILNGAYHMKTGSPTILTRDYFYYDHLGRLVSHKQKIDNEPIQLIAENTYDELGQLIKKKVGGQTALDGYTDIDHMDVTFDGTIYHDPPPPPDEWGWPSKLKTKGVIEEDGGVSYTILQNDKHVRVGLVKNSIGIPPSNGYMDYGIYHNPSIGVGRLQVLEGGNWITIADTYEIGDSFKIQRIDDEVKYYKNGGHLKTVAYTGNIDVLMGKVSFSGPGSIGIEDFTLLGPNINGILQTVDYKYNIRGWLTDINNIGTIPGFGLDNDLFRFKINYNLPLEGDVVNQDVIPLYNGNISQTIWKTLNTDSQRRTYGYKYDPLNRITSAVSRKGNDLNSVDNYSVYAIDYDKNGNLGSLTRNGHGGLWDNLTYDYSGNKLLNVADNAPNSFKDEGFKDGYTGTQDDYEYDFNGNMEVDRNKNISITYNHLNLPEVVTQVNNLNASTIQYVYDATGVKMAKIYNPLVGGINPPNITQYAGNFIYQKNGNGDNVLQFFNHPEGYVEPTPVGTSKSVKGFDSGPGQSTYSSYRYIFQYKDHLGNVRLSYSDSDLNGNINPNIEIIEESNYYPFGLKQKGYNNVVSSNGNGLAQAFKFGGKELNSELELEWYDFGARNYDPALGRWMCVDPLAEEFRSYSPYNFTMNNPINKVDPDGRAPVDWYLNLQNGNTEWHDGSGQKNGYWNLGNSTDIAIGKGYSLQNNGVFTDNNTGKTYGKGDELAVGSTGTFIQSNGSLFEEAQTWVGHNKTGLLTFADDLQTAGDGIAVVGYGATVVGAGVGGVGAAPGAVIAGIGNGVGLSGSLLELGVNLMSENYSGAGENAGFILGGQAIDMTFDRILPGPTPNISDDAYHILKQNFTTVKPIIIENIYEQEKQN